MCPVVCMADMHYILLQGYDFAGTHVRSQCYCGDEYDRYGINTHCTQKCTGDAEQICGGIDAYSVYKTSKGSV